VAEFYNDNVFGFDRCDDVVKAAFDGEGAGATTTDGFVDYGEGERVLEEIAPAYGGLLES
jgi:hypothetical protein